MHPEEPSQQDAATRGGGPLDRVAWPVRTERLVIRRAHPADADAVWAYRRLEATSYWLTYWIRDHDEWRTLFTEPPRLGSSLVIEREGRVVGDLMVRVDDAWAQTEVADQARAVQAELGWCLDPGHTGQGYATEAVQAVLHLCFVDLGLRRVVANAFADNQPSWHLAERLGMRRELHTVRESLHRERGWLDGYGYALLADEWRDANRS